MDWSAVFSTAIIISRLLNYSIIQSLLSTSTFYITRCHLSSKAIKIQSMYTFDNLYEKPSRMLVANLIIIEIFKFR